MILSHISLDVLNWVSLMNFDSHRLPNNALTTLELVSYDFFSAGSMWTIVGYWYPPSKIAQTSALGDRR